MPDHHPPLRLGVVGCGEIAQIMHLPVLAALPGVEVVALCDVSPAVVDAVGERHGVARRHVDHAELIAHGGLDAIAVLTMDHRDAALAGADAGLHLLVEKPLAFTAADARAIADAARTAGVTLMVGYQRSFDPAYEAARDRVRAMASLRLTRVHDLAGDFALHGPLHDVVERTDLAPDVRRRAREAVDAQLAAAVGPADAELLGDLQLLCSHDVAALRGMIGPPLEILHSCRSGPAGLLAVLDHGDRGRATFAGDLLATLPGWDQRLAVHGDDADVEVRFSHPYLRQWPSVLEVRERVGDAAEVRTSPVSHEDPFRREWAHFAHCVRTGATPRTDGAGAVRDVELIEELVRAAAPA